MAYIIHKYNTSETEQTMPNIDISKNNLFIHKFIRVIQNQNLNSQKPIQVNGRLSDAFVYILSGSCTYVLDHGDTFTAKAGDILYLSHHAVYTMYIQDTNYRFIFCDFEFLSASCRKSTVYTPINQPETEALFHKLLKAYQAGRFSECMSFLYTVYGIILTEGQKIYLPQNTKDKLHRAKEMLDTVYKDPDLSIRSFAEQFHMSEVYFRRLFKAGYGIAPSQYIISLRLKHAKELMKYPFLSLEECALQSGFSSLQYFCRVFKQATGTTPAAYRKQMSCIQT